MNTLTTSKVLRRLGATILVASGITFMLEGWSSLTSLGKYGSFSVFTLTLALAGIFCARRLRENKGARTFLALAVATGAAHFSQLGAMLLAFVQGAPSTGLPGVFVYQAPSAWVLAPLILASAMGVGYIGWLGFSALCRAEAPLLTRLFLLLNTLLLLPFRDNAAMAAALALGVGVLIWAEQDRFTSVERMRTPEALAARLILATPVLALLGRSMLYPAGDAFAAELRILGFAILFFLVPAYSGENHIARVARWAAMIPLAFGTLLLGESLSSALSLSAGAAHSLEWLPITGAFFVLAPKAHGSSSGFRSAGAWLALASSLGGLVSPGGILITTATLVIGTLLATAGVRYRERSPLLAGFLCVVLGLAWHLSFAFEFCARSPWATLAVLGTAAILGSSYLEKQEEGYAIRMRIALRQKFVDWS